MDPHPRTPSPPRRSVLRVLAEYDFVPAFSARVRRVFLSPLGVLLIAAAVAVLAGLAVHPRVFLLAGGLGAVAAAGVCWPWLTARGLRGSVRFDRTRATEGDEVGVIAEVTNHLPWPAWGLVARDAVTGQSVRLPTIPGRTKAACRWVFVPPWRGEHPATPPRVVTDFPFGLWEAGRDAETPNRLVVWPKTLPVGPVPVTGGADVVEGNVTRSKVGSTGDVLGVRPYRRGDSPRRVHWAQSAKHDRLVVCELQSNSRPVVLIVLDADSAVHTPGADGSREWAVRVAGSLAKGWLEAGAQVGVAFGETIIPPQAGGGQVVRVLDALARLPDGEKPLSEVLASPAVRTADGVTVVVTSSAGRARVRGPAPGDVRWAVLHTAGFGGTAGEAHPSTCDEAPPRQPTRAWLDIPSAAEVAHRLRCGTAEASHGT